MPTLRKSAYCVSNLACLYHLVGARLHLGQWIHFQWRMRVKSLSGVRLFVTPWTVVYQAPPSMGFSRQEYWSGLPFPSPGNLPDPGIEPRSPSFQADALTSEPPGKPYEASCLFPCRQDAWAHGIKLPHSTVMH